jgi:hypothetical protein
MPDPLLVVLLVACFVLVALALGSRSRGASRRLGDPPNQVITTRGFSPWGWWGGSDLVFRTSKLFGPRGRRHVPRGTKARGEPDLTLRRHDPPDAGG